MGLNTHQTQVTDTVTKWANSVVPCEVITPIDCFSDGAELLVYDTEYYIYDERNDRESKFNWTTYPLLDTNRNITDVLGYEFRNVQGYRDKPAISDLHEPEEVSNVLRNGCSGVSQQWNKNQLVSNNTLQSSIHIMSADTLYQHYAENGVKSFIIPKINSNGRRPPKIWWSPEKASEVLEEWLKQLIEDIESQEETYFFSPNFIQLENLSIKDIVRQHSEVLLFNCLAAAFAFVLLRFNNILLTMLLFILINIVIFGSYTVAWAAIILYQALEVRFVIKNIIFVYVFYLPVFYTPSLCSSCTYHFQVDFILFQSGLWPQPLLFDSRKTLWYSKHAAGNCEMVIFTCIRVVVSIHSSFFFASLLQVFS